MSGETDVRKPDDPSGEIVVKDPSRKSFWRTRNLVLLILTALLPVVGKSVWDSVSEFVTNHKEMRARLERHTEKIDELDERTNNRALWEALTEERNRGISLRVELEVMKRLFDREFARSSEKALPPSTVPGSEARPPKKLTREDLLKMLEESEAVQKSETFKNQFEQRFPEQRPPLKK